mmetsp:Transcript_54021/g.160177  ORF Transcript_54021/g.160177 Transcript_54021/m.160177 type:complete len:420 (+) Transcript_54021:1513-2772(+)
MQLCELTMRQWLQADGRDGSLEANRPYLVQVLRGLHHIHQASLIHRDLTPANVFITHDKGGEKTFKIGDFGLSREMTADMPGNLPSVLSALDGVGNVSPIAPDAHKKGSQKGRRSADGSVRGTSRQVTRGVGTTLYMSPEQRASLPYDHKVDVYSVGVIVLEMCYPVSTQMERFEVLSKLQARELPEGMCGTQVGDLVLWLTSESPAERPSLGEILASPLLAPQGNIHVRAERSQMHALMPAIHALIEQVQRVRSFSAQDADTPADVSLEYCVEPADDDLTTDAPRAALERLHTAIMGLAGVNEVSGSGLFLRSSPLPSPGFAPTGSPSAVPTLERLELPPTARIPVSCGPSSPPSSHLSSSISPPSPLSPTAPPSWAASGGTEKATMRRVHSMGDATQHRSDSPSEWMRSEPRRFLSG